MIIGVPKEIKDHENRVAATPAGVEEMAKAGHTVLVQQGAGTGSGISDDEYAHAGARIVASHQEVYQAADLILKVKEPQPEESALLREGQILMAYLHLAAETELAQELIQRRVTGVAYETIQLPQGGLPCLTPMSEIAGKMTVQIGAQYLERTHGGRGVLLGGVPGVPPANVVIVGGGTVGTQAAKVALGMGAQVTIIDISTDRLRYLDDVLSGRYVTLMSSRRNIERACLEADLVIGAVLVPGARAPRLVTEDMVQKMQEGAVVIDVAVDQGGCIETVDRATTHSNPTYVKYGVVHYAVPNIPGAVPRTATFALANATLPYVLAIAKEGPAAVAHQGGALSHGFNVVDGQVVHKAVATALDRPYVPLDEVFA